MFIGESRASYRALNKTEVVPDAQTRRIKTFWVEGFGKEVADEEQEHIPCMVPTEKYNRKTGFYIPDVDGTEISASLIYIHIRLISPALHDSLVRLSYVPVPTASQRSS